MKQYMSFYYLAIMIITGTIFGVAASLWAEETIKTSAPQGVSSQRVPAQKDPDPWRRDPFQLLKGTGSVHQAQRVSPGKYINPQGRPDDAFDSIRLQGIMHVESASYALVNAKVFKVGDSIADGVIIKEIGKYHIVVRENGLQRSYNIFQGKLK